MCSLTGSNKLQRLLLRSLLLLGSSWMHPEHSTLSHVEAALARLNMLQRGWLKHEDVSA